MVCRVRVTRFLRRGRELEESRAGRRNRAPRTDRSRRAFRLSRARTMTAEPPGKLDPEYEATAIESLPRKPARNRATHKTEANPRGRPWGVPRPRPLRWHVEPAPFRFLFSEILAARPAAKGRG